VTEPHQGAAGERGVAGHQPDLSRLLDPTSWRGVTVGVEPK